MNTSIRYHHRWALAICAIAFLAVSPLSLQSANERRAAAAAANASLDGKTFVVAGRLPALTAAEATSLIKGAGGTVANRVTRTTQYLVAGARPGANLEQARTLGVTVIDEAELRRMLGMPAHVAKKKREK